VFCEIFCVFGASLFEIFDKSKMSDAAAATAAPAKATKKRATKAKKPADHPKYVDMVKSALGALKVRIPSHPS